MKKREIENATSIVILDDNCGYNSSKIINDIQIFKAGDFEDGQLPMLNNGKLVFPIKKLGKNTIGCRRLPHGKYQYQVHLKKDIHQRITKQERENLWSFLERNVDNCLVTNKYVLDYLEGKYPHCYHGYFYVSEQKMLTPIYMLAQKAIDKVIKYVKIKNESNKKIKRK